MSFEKAEEHNSRAYHWILQLICTVITTFVEVSVEQDLFVDITNKMAAYW